jgi:polar amino acid transport system substrate-binding protein
MSSSPDSSLRAIAEDLAPTGTLRAAINLGNPVLAGGTPESPTGVTVDIARELGSRLGVRVGLRCVDAARKSYEAMVTGAADICFLAIEPAREADVAFTPPYVVIEGVFAVPVDSPLMAVADVDRDGVRIGVKHGSAYDLYLTRTFQQATVVRGDEGVAEFRRQGLEVAAGIRQPLGEYVESHSDLRLIDDAFMQIRQAVGTTTSRSRETKEFLSDVIAELVASGFIADALRRAGQATTLVAPPG